MQKEICEPKWYMILVKIRAYFYKWTLRTRMYKQICYLIHELLIVNIIALCFLSELHCVFTLFWVHCPVHPSWLRMSITVKSAAEPAQFCSGTCGAPPLWLASEKEVLQVIPLRSLQRWPLCFFSVVQVHAYGTWPRLIHALRLCC